MLRTILSVVATLCVATAVQIGAAEAQNCASRGTLDARYCDADGDLLADVPKDKSGWKNPDTLIFSYTPVEDPSVYENVFEDFMTHLGKVTGKRVRWFAAESYAAQIEAMRSGRLHIAGVASGATPYAVNLAGFRPLVAMEKKDGTIGYTLQLIVPADSSIKSVADLKGKRVAHVAPSSNSGDTAPRVLFKEKGIQPGTDYEVLFSGKHDNSIMGVVNKDYDAAPIASNVMERMVARGMFKADAVRIVYESNPFPRTAFGVAHDLNPELQQKIQEAFLTFDFLNSKLAKEFKDEKGFKKIDYKDAWSDIRTIQKETGVTYTQDGLSKLKGD
ncbi:phosphate/phosphite/phosphonate ABC transporter substrate-binding protein [Microvirga alba]|uniref:Phosphate/phosphite/phosphonate ABC transporter substrate-binding protein n=1 Tax=Microvirga alba TaxID=2791025 RepID=A0A931FL93_9HYPH|nr:phosphate/phosphite/phosphonate ABC transporter substrate-binding protein [Microvirga alba]MBF9231904.1 phosphate/phosphite/phosphonate ABC transporter substrate-binding protein [Microvirga alba]